MLIKFGISAVNGRDPLNCLLSEMQLKQTLNKCTLIINDVQMQHVTQIVNASGDGPNKVRSTKSPL